MIVEASNSPSPLANRWSGISNNLDISNQKIGVYKTRLHLSLGAASFCWSEYGILLQFGQRLLDAAHGFNDVLVAGGVAHAEAFGRTEGIAADGCHVAYLKEVHSEVGRIVDGTLTVGLAEVA